MLGLGLSLAARRGAFSPRSLFAAGEVGAWYDPSDLTTLFQDAAGTTPVTAAGQVVGLMLDKSRGLTLGAELVTNGDFSNGTTGWAAGFGGESVTLNASSGAGVLTVVSGYTTNATGRYVQAISGLTVGKTYRIAVGVFSSSGVGDKYVGWTSSSAGTGGVDWFTNHTTPRLLTATATTMYVWFGFNNASTGATITIDNISVRELPGNHATQSGATSVRPIYRVDANGRPYLEFDGIDDWLVTGTITPGTDKAQVFAGLSFTADNASGTICEFGPGGAADPGSFFLRQEVGGVPQYQMQFRSASAATGPVAAYTLPVSDVVAGICDLGAPLRTLRVDGATISSGNAPAGGGNFNAYPMFIGRRNGVDLPGNIRLHGLIVRFGANLSAAQISNAERWLARRTGVTI